MLFYTYIVSHGRVVCGTNSSAGGVREQGFVLFLLVVIRHCSSVGRSVLLVFSMHYLIPRSPPPPLIAVAESTTFRYLQATKLGNNSWLQNKYTRRQKLGDWHSTTTTTAIPQRHDCIIYTLLWLLLERHFGFERFGWLYRYFVR